MYKQIKINWVTIFIIHLLISCGNSADIEPIEDVENNGQIQTKKKPFAAKLFIETSMSMDGYDEPSAQVHDLRVFIAQMLNKFNAAEMGNSKVFVVNDRIYPHSQNTVGELAVTTQSIFDKSKGDRTKTDFKAIFSEISSNLGSNELGVLFSDLIISKPGTNYTNDLLKEDIEAYFRPIKDKKISTLIVKLNVGFRGKYYYEYTPHRGQLNPEQYKGKRPVYAIFFIPDAILNNFLTEAKYQPIRTGILINPHFSNSILFTERSDYGVFKYSIDEAKSNTGNVVVDEDPRFTTSNDEIHGIYARTHDNEPLRVVITSTFKNLVFDINELSDKSNYVVTAPIDGFIIEKIVIKQNIDSNGNVNIEYTLKATKQGRGMREIFIKMKGDFPTKWIQLTNSTLDSPVDANGKFSYQTYLFQGMTTGIFNSYKIGSSNREIIKININD